MILSTYKWSIEEWHDLINSGVLAGKRVELLEGDIIEMSPEGIPHRNTNHKVIKYLRKLLEGIAEVYESHPVTLDNSEPELRNAVNAGTRIKFECTVDQMLLLSVCQKTSMILTILIQRIFIG